MTPEENFVDVVPGYMRMLMQDFDFGLDDAAAVFGNAGYESNGFMNLQEIKPRSGRGGYGWFQWTGPRRIAYEQYCKRNGFNPASPLSNYKFLFVELMGPEKLTVAAVKKAVGLYDKTVAFEQAFERAGVKNYSKRYAWALTAKRAFLDAVDIEDYEKPLAPPPEGHWWDVFIRLWNFVNGKGWTL